ncbi:hypothetical protein L6452_06000 [Arctium lappa]|uniref:Uncharacterized protein n=1 Tax=Arctium lappa TaxID=4217 RepID=A0ACB9EHW8_ARCLA|nr:hypothetical protein L6452_06000 [Arctium lappa]
MSDPPVTQFMTFACFGEAGHALTPSSSCRLPFSTTQLKRLRNSPVGTLSDPSTNRSYRRDLTRSLDCSPNIAIMKVDYLRIESVEVTTDRFTSLLSDVIEVASKLLEELVDQSRKTVYGFGLEVDQPLESSTHEGHIETFAHADFFILVRYRRSPH